MTYNVFDGTLNLALSINSQSPIVASPLLQHLLFSGNTFKLNSGSFRANCLEVLYAIYIVLAFLYIMPLLMPT